MTITSLFDKENYFFKYTKINFKGELNSIFKNNSDFLLEYLKALKITLMNPME